MASSSQVASVSHPSSDQSWKYDVFLSFRGPDTRKGITSDIYDGLTRRGIKVFTDGPDLKVGDAISPTLLAAIRGSRLAIVVISQNYASSSWCLEELREICECMKDNNRILPLFYDVDPTDVRHQKRSFEEAFSNHEISGSHKSEKVVQWRAALNKVGNFSGWNTQNYKTYKELVNNIVEFVCSKVVPDASESIGDFEAFEATREAMDELLKDLQDEDVTAIGVYGMGGVGKTTLVEHVGAQAKKSGIFDYVTKCVVSQNPDFVKLQDAIAEQLGFKLHEKTEIGRAYRLRKELNQKKKVLIILDDIWERIDLSKIGIPTYMNLRICNSKILLTTRIRYVCHHMECQRMINLNTLSEEDSWNLFKRKTWSFESPTFEGVAMKVARECKGLPISLIAVARALGDKDLEEWKRAAQRLENSQPANPDDKGEAFKCIKLSYDYLKDEECKLFFLLCCLFPEEYNILKEDLFRYGIGKGLFQDAETLEEARDRANSLARHLKDSSLLSYSSNSKYVRLSDIVRDTAIEIAGSEHGFFVRAGCGLKHWPRRIHEGCTAISLMGNDISKLPENLVCPKLQILLLNKNSRIKVIPETFFPNLKELRVLDLSEMTSLYSLPHSLSLLTNLHSLSLDGCVELIVDTSIIGKLIKLEILSMIGVRLEELSIEFGGLINLRIFNNSFGYIARVPPGVISKWTNLEELYINGFWDWGSIAKGERKETNAGFEEVTGLSRLRVLYAHISGVECLPKYVESILNWVKFHITIGGPEICIRSSIIDVALSRSVGLHLGVISAFPNWFRDNIMEKVEDLLLEGCRSLNDIFVYLEGDGRLHGLKQLLLEGLSAKKLEDVYMERLSGEELEDVHMECLSDEGLEDDLRTSTEVNLTRTPALEDLEVLSLDRLDWEESCATIQTLPHGSLFKLKELVLSDCYTSKNALLSLSTLQKLPNLESFHVFGTVNRYLFENNELLVSLLSNLREIDLLDCGTLHICEGPAPPTMFQNLQRLTIENCDMAGSLFTHDVAQSLPQLDSLILCSCLLLERIVEAEKKKSTVLPKLEQLCLRELPLLCYDSASLDIVCPSLEEMDVKECPKFLVSIVDFHGENQVQLHGDPFIGRTEKKVVGDIADYVSTHTVGSEEFQETGQGMDEDMELHTDDEFSTIGIYGTGGAGQRSERTMVIPFGSTSSSAVNWKYDVYLSFRGKDTNLFTSNLCDVLKKRGITMLMDADIQVGDPISLTPINAISESRFMIVILSPIYAASTWCLEELTEICKFMDGNLRIIPVFYAVNSSDVRDQKGRLEDAFTKHERSGQHGPKKVQQWREALRKVGSLRGWLSQDYKTEGGLIEAIVEFLCSKIYTNDFKIFESTKRAMDEVLKALHDEEVAAIGVYGAGGVGKTTMVEHICAKVVYEGMFHHVITAVVSENPDLRELQSTLAGMLGIELEEETDIERSYRLMQKIRRGNRILIVLDDIWESINLSSIGIPGYHELQRSKCKVLFITRSHEVLSAMNCWPNISLGVLSEKDSWTLFLNRARVSNESIISCDAAKKLASLCAGLPIALIAVAKALGGKDNWEEAAQRLANPEKRGIMFTCIKLSYDYLAYDDARSCFLLCCLFPEDYNIQIEDLLKYGMGKGLFKDSKTMQDARSSAHSVVKYLKDCSLLLESGLDGYVKMHDVIRDVAMRISSSEGGELVYVQAGCQLKEWPSISSHVGYFAISLIRNKVCELPKVLKCSKLLILFLQSNFCLDKIPEDFFRDLNKLGVLDMSRTRISLLPISLIRLINLHTLYLDGCLSLIDNIYLVGELKGLKILSMRDLPLVELPKEIGNLKNLRMLDVTGKYVDMVPSKVIQSLDKLEELYMQCNFTDWGSNEAYGSIIEKSGEKNMASFEELTSLSNLNCLKVFISDAKSLPAGVASEPNWVNFDICISDISSIRKMSLDLNASSLCTRALTVNTTINTLPFWFNSVVTSKTEKLHYTGCPEMKNVLVDYDCGRLHAVKYLTVNGPSEKLKVLMDTETLVTNEPVLQNLEKLHLVQVDCLQKLCVGELPQGSLKNLRSLEVKHCYELEDALLPSHLLRRLENLEKLICEEIDELEYVFGCEGLKPEHTVLTQLKEMRLMKLGKLTNIWNGPAPCTIFQNLHGLVVSRCFELKSLFTVDVAQSLLQLEYLSVEDCLSLDMVIETSKETMDNQIIMPRLKNLALIRLPRLASFCGNTGSAIECPRLKTLYEERCPMFSASCFFRIKPINHQQHLDIVRKSDGCAIADREDSLFDHDSW